MMIQRKKINEWLKKHDIKIEATESLNNFSILKEIIEKINFKNGEGEILSLLIDNGLNILLKDHKSNENLLHIAIKTQNLYAVDYLINVRKLHSYEVGNSIGTILHYAVEQNNLDIFNIVINGLKSTHSKNGFKKFILKKNINDLDIFQLAQAKGNSDIINLLLKYHDFQSLSVEDNGNDLNVFTTYPESKDIEEENSIMFKLFDEAVESNNLQLINDLIENGLDIFSCNEDGISPFHKIIENKEFSNFEGSYEIINALANNIQDQFYISNFLKHAIKYNNLSITDILSKKIDDFISQVDGVSSPMGYAIINGYGKAVMIMLSTKNVHSDYFLNQLFEKFSGGETTILHQAIENDDNDLLVGVLNLISYCEVNYLIDSKDQLGKTALHVAIKDNNLTLIKILLNFGADLHIGGMILTPLELAIELKNTEVIEFLSNCKEIDFSGFIAFEEAERFPLDDEDHSKVLEEKPYDYDLDHHSKISPKICAKKIDTKKMLIESRRKLHKAIENNDIEEVKFLSKTEGILASTNKKSLNALHLAVNLSNIEIVKLILDQDISLINSLDKHFDTPLYLSVGKKNVEIIEYLIFKGADLNAQTKVNQTTALHWAVRTKKLKIVKILLKNNIDVNIRNIDGDTALHIAIKLNCKAIINELLDKADLSIVNKNGDNALSLAIQANDEDLSDKIVDFIESREEEKAISFEIDNIIPFEIEYVEKLYEDSEMTGDNE